MKKNGFISEFKTFILRGNVIDLAVGVIIGAAFQAIVNSLVNDIIMPVVGIILGKIDFSALAVTIGDAKITYGNFITAIINFLIMAFVIFCIVKIINKISAKAKKSEAEEEAAAPTTKVCPFCKSEIALDATKCPHCTSDLKE